MPLPTPISLTFMHAPGCHACEEARPAWESFKRRAARFFRLDEVDITQGVDPIGKREWTPSATPSYVLAIGKHAFVIEGSMSEQELDAWVTARLERFK